MNETLTYLYTHIGTFGSLPTHKVYVDGLNNRTKLIFADNSFIYGKISDWALRNSDFDIAQHDWVNEPKEFLQKEKVILEIYRKNHISFTTMASNP